MIFVKVDEIRPLDFFNDQMPLDRRRGLVLGGLQRLIVHVVARQDLGPLPNAQRHARVLRVAAAVLALDDLYEALRRPGAPRRLERFSLEPGRGRACLFSTVSMYAGPCRELRREIGKLLTIDRGKCTRSWELESRTRFAQLPVLGSQFSAPSFHFQPSFFCERGSQNRLPPSCRIFFDCMRVYVCVFLYVYAIELACLHALCIRDGDIHLSLSRPHLADAL